MMIIVPQYRFIFQRNRYGMFVGGFYAELVLN
jgi:hypothetical protein